MTLIPAQSSTPAQSTSAAPSAPSYASAAGSKKAPINSQHGKNSSIPGGRPPITPALPSVQGLNSAASREHSRKNSVTIGNGPSYSGNMNANAIKFGNFSPVMSHNSPQHPHSPAPPSPIPINNAVSGGRPPSIQPPVMTFGSLGNDDRTRQNVPSQPGFHGRRESSHSAAGSDMNQNHRGGYHGRGRGYNNGNNSFGGHHNSMGYPPNNFRGGSGPGGRGGMGYQPGSHNGHNQNRGPPMHVTNSPQPGRSPHLANSQISTPNMPPASLAQPMVSQTSPHQTHGYNNYHQSPMGGMQPNYYPPHQYSQMPHNVGGVPGYQYNAPYGGPPGGPPFNHNFNAPPFTPGQASPMARSASQHSEKLATASPAIVGSTPATPNFVRPKPAASAIRITTPQGDALDLKDVRDRNAAAAAAAAAKAAATSTPVTTAPSRTPAEIQEELRRKIAEATKGGGSKELESKNSAHADAKIKAEADAKPAQEAKGVDEAKAKTETEKVTEREQKDEKKEEAEKTAEPSKNDELEEDEMERMIREMEEADRREAEREAAYKAQQEAKKAAEAQAAAKNKLFAEDDKKLREAEREMERLEEEKERRRAQTGPKPSFKELLAASRAGKEILEPPNVEESITDKMSKMSLEPKVPKIDAPAGSGGSLPRGDKNRKPAALTLTPLATKVEPAQPSAALQSLKSARFLTVINQDLYPPGIMSPNPAINPAVAKKGGKTFQYDAGFLLQFRNVFTEQPSTEFQSQVKSLIGDDNRGSSARGQTPRAASSKGASNPIGAPIGGGFGTGRVVGNGLSRSSTNPMAQFGGRGTAFPGRNPSGNVPNSPRVGSGRGGPRNNSNRPKIDKQAANMPLTAGMEIKPIQVSETGWKPTSVLQKSAVPQAGVPMDPAMVQRKVKAALNKMTPENFDRISEQILTIASQSKDENDGRTLRQVIQLTFEKATDEAHWASMYAKFCKKMLESTSMDIKDETIKDKAGNVVAGGALFRKYLLNRCQEEFERGWKRSEAKSTESGASKTDGAAALLSDEYYAEAAAKRRGLGLVKFIGELYKLGMLTDRIMHGCIQGLVDVGGVVPDEAEVESLSKLLTTVGGSLEQSRGSGPIMDVYFGRIKLMIENPELNSRMRFMLMDVVDLRKNGWKGKEQNKGPKTLEEVRQEAEAAAAQKAAEAAKMTRGGSGRPPIGHGDARHGYSNNAGHGNSSHIGKDDMKRLRSHGNTATNRNSHGGFTTLGPSGNLASRNNSSRNRPLGPGGNLGIGRGSEDSASSSRNGQNSANTFTVLASLDAVPNSPPSAAVSPALSKATPDTGKGE